VDLVLGYLLIFGARVIDVSLGTVRTLFIVRGKRLQAAACGFFEVIVYIFALNKVFHTLNEPGSLLFYALGFAAGNYVGSLVEEKLALGFLTVQAITLCQPEELATSLRAEGFGVTVMNGMGKEGTRQVLNVVLHRKDLGRLFDLITNWDCQAFVTVFDARSARGGDTLQKGK
jgi:uncharacterized protein YebE (UPF0316 family)